jgi:hypothetical protein
MATQPIEDWAHLPWRKLERVVYRLQTRIFRASERGNVQAVHSLQRLLMKSEAARCLAVRRVTQDNQGKHTPGVDGIKACHRRNVRSWSSCWGTPTQSSLDRPDGSGSPSPAALEQRLDVNGRSLKDV